MRVRLLLCCTLTLLCGIHFAYALTDRPGQIVHHLSNISGEPAVKALAFTPDGRELWGTLLNNTRRGVSVFDAKNYTKIADINLAGNGGVEIIFSADGSKAYVSQMETAEVFEIDVATHKVLRVFQTGSSWTKVIALSSDEKILYASNWLGNSISRIDVASGKLLGKIKTVRTPRGLYATKDGKYLYVAGFDTGELEKIDLVSGTSKIIFKSGGALRHIVGDETKGVLYISDMAKNVIWQLTLVDDSVKKFATTDSHPNTIALSPDDTVLFVSCRGHNFSKTNYYVPGPDWGSVLLFDTSDGHMLDAIVGGNQPTALAVSPDSTTLAFSDFLDGTVELFSVPAYETLKNGLGGRSGVYKKELLKK